MPRARIQQIRIAAHDVERLADFYRQVFDMKVVLKRPTDAEGRLPEMVLTDGYVSLGILKAGVAGERYRPEGLQGIGFLVEDLEEVEAMAPKYHPMVGPVRRRGSADDYAEAELLDPIGISVELTERGFGVEVPEDVSRISRSADPWALPPETRPRIQHVATGPYDQEKMVDFYCNVFDMKVVYRRDSHVEDGGRPGGIFITDGRINFALNVPTTRNGRLTREGLGHFGFYVNNADETFRRAEEAGALKANPVPSGVYAEGHIIDPIGVRVDVAERGFAIEVPEDATSFQGHDARVGRVVTSFATISEEERARVRAGA